MNTNMTGFRGFSEIFCALDESCLSIGRVKHQSRRLSIILGGGIESYRAETKWLIYEVNYR